MGENICTHKKVVQENFYLGLTILNTFDAWRLKIRPKISYSAFKNKNFGFSGLTTIPTITLLIPHNMLFKTLNVAVTARQHLR